MRAANTKMRGDILEALAKGLSITEMATLFNASYANVQQYLTRLTEEGLVEKVKRGDYQIVAQGNGKAAPAPASSRRVEIPQYMKSRNPVTVFVEKSPVEIEHVMRLELQMNGQWFPFPVLSDLRVCVGNDTPRWSSTQETYLGVTNYRVTLKNGEQQIYHHDPSIPFTVDAK